MSVERFDHVANTYDNFRPPYSGLDKVLSNFKNTSIVADIGSGTGILSRQLLKYFNKVYAIEPNEKMINVSRKKKEIHHIVATASKTTLKSKSIDIIFVAQAIHWFDPITTKKEFKRILKPNGHIIILNNSYIDSYQKEISKIAPSSTVSRAPGSNVDTFSPGDYHVYTSLKTTKISCDAFIGLNLTQSRTPDKDTDEYDTFVKQLTSIFKKHSINGKILNSVRTRCFLIKFE
jgi:ubiquinone/menaquinone biosynthesis C-methylase UbiE